MTYCIDEESVNGDNRSNQYEKLLSYPDGDDLSSCYLLTEGEVIDLKGQLGDRAVIHEDYYNYECELEVNKYNIVRFPDDYIDEDETNLFWNNEYEEWEQYDHDIIEKLDIDIETKALEESRIYIEFLDAYKRIFDEEYDKLETECDNTTSIKHENGLRSLHDIADDIKKYWRGMNYRVMDYVSWIGTINSIYDRVREQRGRDYIMEFFRLSKEWNDDKAKELKKELQKHLELDIKKYILCYEDGGELGTYITDIHTLTHGSEDVYDAKLFSEEEMDNIRKEIDEDDYMIEEIAYGSEPFLLILASAAAREYLLEEDDFLNDEEMEAISNYIKENYKGVIDTLINKCHGKLGYLVDRIVYYVDLSELEL